MAQKNFFALVTLIACMLTFAPAEWILLKNLSGHNSSDTTIAVANVFGILAAVVLITAVFNRKKSRVFVWSAIAWCALSGIIAMSYGFAAAASLLGGAVVTIVVFALFVLAIIRYEDLGELKR